MRYDQRGRRIGSSRLIRESSHIPLLVGGGCEDLAYTEVLRLELEAVSIQRQLENEAGYEELKSAVDALRAANLAIKRAVSTSPIA